MYYFLRFVFVLAIFNLALTGFSQPPITWVGGTQAIDQHGVYTGIPIPGGRLGGITWTGNDGRFYLYGGYGFGETGSEGGLNDMWRYNPVAKTWTWLSGTRLIDQAAVYGTQTILDPLNTPGNRMYAASWVDNNGNLWLFGGLSSSGSNFNDMWRYDLAANQWAWIKGSNQPDQSGVYNAKGTPDPNSTPGARSEIAGYWKTNDGSFWLFGGAGYDGSGLISSTLLNDVWKFDPVNNVWTWMHGEETVTDPSGVYGTRGQTDPTNRPGSRYGGSGWFDAGTGNFWLFGGKGFGDNEVAGEGVLNDLWRYNIAANSWTWIKGDITVDEQGTYGTKGTAAGANTPGGRSGHRLWVDNGGVFLFGGSGLTPNNTSNPGHLNDTWQYNPNTGFWTWLSGDDYAEPLADYTANFLGGRRDAMVWKTNAGPFYSFGGYGSNDVSPGYLNDLWTINTSNIALPVNWGEVSVKEINDRAEIQWTTLQEMKTSSFTIERSVDEGPFISIGTVLARGESNSPRQYKFVDASPVEGRNYYRIRENDIDGKQFYSKVVQLDINRTGKDAVSLFPNPVSNVLTIKLPDNNSKATVSLYNFKGDLILRKSINQGSVLSLGHIPAGMYFAKVIGSGRTFIKTIIKQ